MADGDNGEFGDAQGWALGSDGVEDGVALRTDGQAIGCVFDVAAGVDGATLGPQHAAHLHLGVGTVGLESGFLGQLQPFGISGRHHRYTIGAAG